MSKHYVVYENDLKFKKHRHIQPENVIWNDDSLKDRFYNDDLDTINYRITECEKTNYLYLDLSNLDLPKMPKLDKYANYEQIKKIKFLFINNNNISSISNELKIFTDLEVLDISWNNIDTIGYVPSKIKEFVCHNNKLSELPHLNNIEKIDCSHNYIKSIFTYNNLDELICFNNEITHLNEFANLKKLICKNNPLTSINKQPKLNYLECSFTKLSGQFSNMPALKFLVCNHTDITDISNLNSIESLEMVGTNIQKIPYIQSLKILLFHNDLDIMLAESYKIIDYIKEHDNSCVRFE